MSKILIDPTERFAFGQNWSHFLSKLTEDRILEAEKSLQEKLGCTSLEGKTFFDVGSGSGLFSLAAHRLGATVLSFDYDPDSVNCTRHLKAAYGTTDQEWIIDQGSVLSLSFLQKMIQQHGLVDILYSWGVLHHTGHMIQAFENVAPLVKEDGLLFISIYNDQGSASQRWKWIKQKYVTGGSLVKTILTFFTMIRVWAPTLIKTLFKFSSPFKKLQSYGQDHRGMSAWHDLKDWVGGYPFEVAKPEEVFAFFQGKGFILEKLKTCAGGIGCNEHVFKKRSG